jgi:hypothetical protein
VYAGRFLGSVLDGIYHEVLEKPRQLNRVSRNPWQRLSRNHRFIFLNE